MPRMLPPVVDPATPSSERRVFEAIASAADLPSWTVLHSLGLSSAYTGEFGEIDFVALIPGSGIVCIEVKGGGVRSDDGQWSTTKEGGVRVPLKRSPFRQAQEGMWKLFHALEARFGKASVEARCPLGWMVVLPDVDCPPVTPEFTRAEVVDRNGVNAGIMRALAAAPSLALAGERPTLAKPTAGTCERILSFLRPSFERVASSASTLWEIESRMKALTEEQYAVLDGIWDNGACLVHGGAGTGKTLLGIEAARRTAAAGGSALLTCFNRNLGRWLEQEAVSPGPGRIVAGNLHRLLHQRVEASSLAGELAGRDPSDPDFWDRLATLGALAIADSGERFDTIVVDEAQDFPPALLQRVIHEWRTSDEGGRVLLLGDFARQAIYETTGSSIAGYRKAFAGLASFGLSLNCRNTRRIVSATERLTGAMGVRTSERQPDGDPVQTVYYGSPEEGIEKLDGIMRSLREVGYKAEDIVIIGPRRMETSLVGRPRTLGGYKVRQFETDKAGFVGYSTIHSFKGLERAVVIVVDVAAGDEQETDSMLYVAMSRAKARLLLLVESASRQELDARRARHMEARLTA